MEKFFNKGFGRKHNSNKNNRIPPGQYEARDFPVLTAGPTPHIKTSDWSFTIQGLVQSPKQWTWKQFNLLPKESFTKDIHCVTKWSKLDTNWMGVSIDTLLEQVVLMPNAEYAMAYSYGGYNANIPVKDLREGKAFIGLQYDGSPLSAEHGGPARLVVPHLYFWKSAKWITGLRFMEKNEPGFWEKAGYSIHGDPWMEQRYRSDD